MFNTDTTDGYSGQKKLIADDLDIANMAVQSTVCAGTDLKGTTVLMQEDNYGSQAAVICQTSQCEKGISVCQKGKFVCLCV
jgi:hypothetical protein